MTHFSGASPAKLCLGAFDSLDSNSLDFDSMCSSTIHEDENDMVDDGVASREDHKQSLMATVDEKNVKVNPYHVLQVRRDATPTEIRQSYRRLALWHHPGRTHACKQERQRRLQVFEVLAACYETLMHADSRRRFDAHLKSIEKAKLTSGLPSGGMFVGGKRLFGRDSSDNDTLSPTPKSWGAIDDDRIPGLSRSSTTSSTSSEDDASRMMILSLSSVGARSEHTSLLQPRQLVDVSTSGSGSEAEAPEMHFTEVDTNRLFGGPLSDLYRVRSFVPFTDSFAVFEDVFGSKIFNISSDDIGRLEKWTPLRSTPTAGWEGTREVSTDKKTCVLKTSRLLHNRKLTRTETVTLDPKTKKRYSMVTVTAEDIPEDAAAEEEVPEATCLMCFAYMQQTNENGVCRKKEKEDEMWCDLYVLYNQIVEELRLACMLPDLTDTFGCGSFSFPVAQG